MRYLPLIMTACAALQFNPLSQASPIVLNSPDSANTYADNSMLWHQLHWKSRSQELVATITFSNYHHVSDIEPAHDETFAFRFPGVKFTPETGVFSVRTARGAAVPIATLRKSFLGQKIELSPDTQVRVTTRSGHVMVTLVNSRAALDGDQWVETYHSGPAVISRASGSPLGSS